MTRVAVQAATARPGHAAVITADKGEVGGHVGILYKANDEGTYHHLHLAWHNDLRVDGAIGGGAVWVEPALDELELCDLRTSAGLIARRLSENRVPYAFRPADARFDEAGVLQLNGSRGLTCATFVLLVLAHASIVLLDVATWAERTPERVRADEAAQNRLVNYLMSRPASKRHGELVAKEVGCVRFRAEEVAAASGMSGHPIAFARAEPAGRALLDLLLEHRATVDGV